MPNNSLIKIGAICSLSYSAIVPLFSSSYLSLFPQYAIVYMDMMDVNHHLNRLIDRSFFCFFFQGTNSFLWQVRRHPPAYFLGTIHVPYTRVWDYIPQNTKVAFRESENIFVELDLTDPNTMTQLANCQLLPNGENLSEVLPHSIYRRLKTHLQYVKRMMPQWLSADQRGRGFYADYLFEAIVGNWERKRPIWVMLVIDSLTEADIKSREIPVLDLYLAQEATRLNKRTGAVEQVEEQCVPLNGLNFTQVSSKVWNSL